MDESVDEAIVPPSELSPKAHQQLLDETIAHAEDLIRLLGGEWYDLGSPPVSFDPANRGRWIPEPCDMNDVAERYAINLMQHAPVADPLAKIQLVRAHWQKLGYEVRQIGPAESSTILYTEVFVDLPFGAALGFSASTQMMSISPQSECVKVE
jgi:hypothetical protein